VSLDHPRRLHGYSVTTDLARHYTLSEVAFLSWSGELPDRTAGSIVEACLIHLSAAPSWEAPTHAGVLARVSGAPPSGVAGACAVALAEAARWEMAQRRDLFAWLASDRRAPPAPHYCAQSNGDCLEAEQLRAILSERGDEPGEGEDLLLSVNGALCSLHRHGLNTAALLEAAWVWARLPCVLAEAFTWAPGRVDQYPLDLPAFRYQDPET
jgi:hypothetical protein